LHFIGGELEAMDWLRNIFRLEAIRNDISSTLAEFPKLPNATALKEKFEAERNAQKENAWACIGESIETAMSRGKGYILITANVYKNITFDELLYEVERAEYKLKDNRCCDSANSVKYCYDMGYDLSICWE
jgi:hypothetical protein